MTASNVTDFPQVGGDRSVKMDLLLVREEAHPELAGFPRAHWLVSKADLEQSRKQGRRILFTRTSDGHRVVDVLSMLPNNRAHAFAAMHGCGFLNISHIDRGEVLPVKGAE